MSHEIVTEVRILIGALFLGEIACFLYDLLRIFRRLLPRGSFITGLEDILWWISFSVTAFVFMYKVNGGVVRAYILVFILLGMLLWEVTIGRFVVCYISRLLHKILKIFHKLLKKILKPFTIQNNRVKR